MPYPDGSKIEWREYSEKAFVEAKQQLKPIVMLISAPWCSWCHTYEQETLEDADIARNVNRHFIPIFIDADKRQDLTRQYLAGGWPTTVLFDFHGSKLISFSGYLNKTSLMELLANAAEGKLQPEKLPSQVIDERRPQELGPVSINQFISDYDGEVAYLFDELYGGFGKGQKGINAYALDYLVVQFAQKKKALWRDIVAKTLQGMGRLMDFEEGGFYRYAQTRDWGEPHYEKMLRENAMASDLLIKAGKVLGREEFTKMAVKNFEWMKNTLNDQKEGGFYGSSEANSHYYTSLLEDRKKMIPPFVDRTKYCEWNAEAAIAFLHAHKLLSKLEYWEIADGTLEFMRQKLLTEKGMLHYCKEDGNAALDGLLLDNAWSAVAFFEAFRIGKQEEHKKIGEKLLEYILANFYDESKGGFIERNSGSVSMYREGEAKSESIRYYDNAVCCWALVAGFGTTSDKKYLEIAKKVLSNFLYTDNEIDHEALIAQIASNILQIQQ